MTRVGLHNSMKFSKGDVLFLPDPIRVAVVSKGISNFSLDVRNYRTLASLLDSLGRPRELGELIQRIDISQVLSSEKRKSFDHLPFSKQASLFHEHQQDSAHWLEQVGTLVDQAKLLITYEASPALKQFMLTVDTPHIDIRISPIRFLSDLVFRITNNFEKLSSSQSLESAKSCSVDAWRKSSANQDFSFENENDIGLYFLQLEGDASLISSDGPLSLQDQLALATSVFPKLKTIAVAHPYQKLNVLSREISRGDWDIELTGISAYTLLSQSRDFKVASFSSSVLEEASYFGKTTQTLSEFSHESQGVDMTNFELIAFLERILERRIPVSRSSSRSVTESFGISWRTHSVSGLPTLL